MCGFSLAFLYPLHQDLMFLLIARGSLRVFDLRPINAWLLLALPTLDLICPCESHTRLNISSELPLECVLALE